MLYCQMKTFKKDIFMEFSERLKELRKKANLTQTDLANLLGIKYQNILRWENGSVKTGKNNLEKLAKIFNVSISYLLGETTTITENISKIVEQLDDNQQKIILKFANNQLQQKKDITYNIPNAKRYRPEKIIQVPLLGEIAAGIPFEAIEEFNGTRPVSNKYGNENNLFWLLVNGDSMEPQIHNGDYALIRKSPDIINGKIYAVRFLNDNEVTLKTVYQQKENEKTILRLIAENTTYSDLIADDDHPAEIIGKLVLNETVY